MEGTIGEIRMCGFNFAPRDWAFCAGQTLAITDYQALYSLIGTYYGGDGIKDFMLPDLRGRMAIGAGQGKDLTNRIIGTNGGFEETPISTDQMPQHAHQAVWGFTGGSAAGNATLYGDVSPRVSLEEGDVTNPSGAIWGKFSPQQFDPFVNAADPNVTNMAPQDVQVNGDIALGLVGMEGTVSVMDSGAGLPISRMQPYAVVHYIICLNGSYPSRN